MHDDVFHAHAQHLCCDLRDDGIGTRANISSSYQDVEGAIIVEFDTGSSHVQARDGGPMHGERDTDAAAETAASALTTLLLPAKFLLDDLQALWQATAFDNLSIALFALTQGFCQGIFIALFQPVFTA